MISPYGVPALAGSGSGSAHAPTLSRFHAPTLSLPSLHRAIPRQFTYRSGDSGLGEFASLLLDAGVLTPDHWAGRNKPRPNATLIEVVGTESSPSPSSDNSSATLSKSCERALSEFCHHARPEPLVWFKLYFSNDFEHLDENSYDSGSYAEDRHLKAAPVRLGALALHLNPDGLEHRVIGPMLQALEAAHPRLGQTILMALENGLAASCRALTPRCGYEWAQFIYWGGEADEEMRLEEMYEDEKQQYDNLSAADKKKHIPPTPDGIDMFRKEHYDRKVPLWAGSGAIRPLNRQSLARLRASKTPDRRFQNIIHAALALLDRLAHTRRPDRHPDNSLFDSISWEIVPFLLRWSADDPLGQIYDDCVNNIYENGQERVDVNAIFAFHDLNSLRNALKRLRNYLEIMQLSETLIRHLGKSR